MVWLQLQFPNYLLVGFYQEKGKRDNGFGSNYLTQQLSQETPPSVSNTPTHIIHSRTGHNSPRALHLAVWLIKLPKARYQPSFRNSFEGLIVQISSKEPKSLPSQVGQTVIEDTLGKLCFMKTNGEKSLDIKTPPGNLAWAVHSASESPQHSTLL